MKKTFLHFILPLILCPILVSAQYWHNKPRQMRYHPEGEEYVIRNGDRKFNRALYGSHTAFRVEAGDLPEFGLYLPGMGGNIKLGLANASQSKWLSGFDEVEARYNPGRMTYLLSDSVFGKLRVDVLAMSEADGLVIKISIPPSFSKQSPAWVEREVMMHYGGASGKKFSRNGDLGVDPPNCFELKPEDCVGNKFSLRNNAFELAFASGSSSFRMSGWAPLGASMHVLPENILELRWTLQQGHEYYVALQNTSSDEVELSYEKIPAVFAQSEAARSKTAQALRISTPDPYINPIGGALAVAADGVWDGTAWQHGAIGWRMPLPGWRAAYVGDVLGWHDRARTHFDGYAAAQVTSVAPSIPHPSQDTALNFARALKKWGTPMYSNGYISRYPNRSNVMNHYDMNLAYIDELLWHFRYNGDTARVRLLWPVLESHLAWEKRNFDPNNDGLYDAYCCIWASDALQYNSGGVTHSSAYNYNANKTAAELAQMLGKDPRPYADEAEKIRKAVSEKLWLGSKGWWAEYVDFMGAKRVHTSAALWTVYHAIDEGLGDPFQNYQATRYVDELIPHLPIRAAGLMDTTFYALSTSTWMPYAWSINNVAFAETYHTALAYWQAGRADEAFRIFKGAILDGQYLGASPGNYGQISFYDAARGECYRDFGDPIGIASRAIVEGLFGITPDALHRRVVIRPGFPKDWNKAAVERADVAYAFERKASNGKVLDAYTISKTSLHVALQVQAQSDRIASLKVDGKPAKWTLVGDAVGYPLVEIGATIASSSSAVRVEIEWGGKPLQTPVGKGLASVGEAWNLSTQNELKELHDPQGVLASPRKTSNSISGVVAGEGGIRTLFVQLAQGEMSWWQPVEITVNATPALPLQPASAKASSGAHTPISLDKILNASVTDIFSNRYLSPRSPYTTLQVPTQGIGEWCHPLETATVNDSALRALPHNGTLQTPLGLPFSIAQGEKNVCFTSLWDSYPNEITMPINGSASHGYLLLVGTTNPMQCHIANAMLWFDYTDGSRDSLLLTPPDNWAPIEQDYFADGHAFRLREPRPYRVHLKTGLVSRDLGADLRIGNLTGGDMGGTTVMSRRIDGGAGIILDLPLNPRKTLKTFGLKTLSNEVVVGLMAITLLK
ncbi:MAG: DUF4450 domain-containing protein [Prevotellaceae bacterium]|jgi:hypothetical protein|nr:DUF4450 domain-containing protein [Prevotellaceae bacterium]